MQLNSSKSKISFFQALIISIIILIIYIALVLGLPDENTRLTANDIFLPIVGVLSTLALFYGAKLSKPYSKNMYHAWLFLALAQLSWTIADTAWMILEVFLHQQPFPSIADGFYLLYYPLFLIGIFYLPSKKLKQRDYLKTIIDISIVMLGTLILYWNFLINPSLINSANDSLLVILLSSAYPIGDLVLLFALLLLIFQRFEGYANKPLLLLILTATIMIISDSIFIYQSLHGTYISGGLSDFGYMLCIIFIGLAGILQGVNVPKYKTKDISPPTSKKISDIVTYLPYIWMIILFFLLIWSYYQKINIDFNILSFGVIIIAVLFIIRHKLSLDENKFLYDELQQAYDEQELKVLQRTEDLDIANKELMNEIAEREKAEKDLQLKAKLLDAANDSIMLHDLDGTPVYMNESAYKSLGYTKEEMMHINIRDMESPDESKNMPSRMQTLMKTGHIFFESENIRKDGSIRPIEVHTQLVDVGDQKLILGTARDITERKKIELQLKSYQKNLEDLVKVRTHALERINIKLQNEINERKNIQEKLKKSETMYRSIFENTGTSTIIIEEDNTISLANSEFEELSGYSKEEIENKKKWTEFVVGEDLPYMQEQHLLRRVDPEKAAKVYEFRFINKKGEVKNIHISVDMFPGTKKSIAALNDVTQLKDAEKKIRKSLKEKEVLLREIHHRVKNNMQIISSLLNIQAHYLDDKKVHDILKESQNRVKSMSMVHEKLYQSRDLSQINLREYIKSITTELLISFRTYSSNVTININFENIWLNMDTVIPCGLIITELVTNSLKYAFPEDGGEINIDLKPLDNDEFLLCVGDNGIGLPEDLNFKESETLGLLLVNSLVEQIDGDISLDRSHGTLFKIKFKEIKYIERI